MKKLIKAYEKLVLNNKFSRVNLEKLLIKIDILRDELYNDIINSKNARENIDKILEDSINFIKFEEKLMCYKYSNAIFGVNLKLLKRNYIKLKNIDKENKIEKQTILTLFKIKKYYAKNNIVKGAKFRITEIEKFLKIIKNNDKINEIKQ